MAKTLTVPEQIRIREQAMKRIKGAFQAIISERSVADDTIRRLRKRGGDGCKLDAKVLAGLLHDFFIKKLHEREFVEWVVEGLEEMLKAGRISRNRLAILIYPLNFDWVEDRQIRDRLRRFSQRKAAVRRGRN